MNFTSVLDNQGLDSVLEELRLVLGLQVDEANGQIILSKP
jgi:hypothetical protein